MIAQVNGIDLYYEETGRGRPLLLVHGNGEDHTIFDEAVAVLSKDFTCYAVDSRGHGKSGAVSELHYRDMAADMLSFLEALDLRDVVFYGFSDGGIIGLMAAPQTDRITTLITSGANLSPTGVKLGIQLFIRFGNFLKKDPKLEMMLREPHITDEQLRAIRVRTLILAGSKDLVLEEETRRIADTIPGAELRILPGEGHGTYIIHKTKIAELIRDFCLENG